MINKVDGRQCLMSGGGLIPSLDGRFATDVQIFPSSSYMKRVGCTTCCDNAQGQTASLLKVLTCDCQGGCVDQTTAQA